MALLVDEIVLETMGNFSFLQFFSAYLSNALALIMLLDLMIDD